VPDRDLRMSHPIRQSPDRCDSVSLIAPEVLRYHARLAFATRVLLEALECMDQRLDREVAECLHDEVLIANRRFWESLKAYLAAVSAFRNRN
jgi:hypothetical protein